jgi:hypothetical protein
MALSDNIRMAWIRVIDKTKSSATHRGECSSKFLFIFGIGALRPATGSDWMASRKDARETLRYCFPKIQ